MTKIILLIISIFIGLISAVNGWMFLASVCALIMFITLIRWTIALLKSSGDEPHDITESFWHEEINQN